MALLTPEASPAAELEQEQRTTTAESVIAPRGWRAWLELTKPRLSFLSVVSAMIGYVAARPGWDPVEAGGLFAGTLLSAGGALSLNQGWEAETDAKMARTRGRPVPSGRVPRLGALAFGALLGLAGCGLLGWVNGSLPALLSAATILSYVLVYTPLKRRSRWAMEIGAISGSLPPLIGWAAAEASLSPLAWLLFAVLTCWQMPHFLAIAWTYRQEYAAADLPLHSTEDGRGRIVARGALIWTVLLTLVSLLLQPISGSSFLYTAGALLLGVYFCMPAVAWVKTGEEGWARKVFLRSLVYLPAWMLLLALDRLLFTA